MYEDDTFNKINQQSYFVKHYIKKVEDFLFFKLSPYETSSCHSSALQESNEVDGL